MLGCVAALLGQPLLLVTAHKRLVSNSCLSPSAVVGCASSTLFYPPHYPSDVPIVGCVTRLTHQKGIHLIKHAAWRTMERGGQFVLLGSAPDPKVQVGGTVTRLVDGL